MGEGNMNCEGHQQLFAEKRRLESAMRKAPDDIALRDEYFSCLLQISNTHLGVIFISLPEIRTPIMFRSATSDVLNLTNIFSYAEKPSEYAYGVYGLKIPRPYTILDIGAYCGYASIYFAHRFPGADIVCIEPPGANFDVLAVNTEAYDNIRRIPAAIWPERSQVAQSGHVSGDWGNIYSQATGSEQDQAFPAYTIDDVLRMVGWADVDFIKCQAENALIDVLCTGERNWLSKVSCVTAIRPGGRWPHPDGDALLEKTFPLPQFQKVVEDNGLHTFMRCTAVASADVKTKPASARLVPPSPETRPIVVNNVPVGENGFYKFGYSNLQLRPSPPGAPLSTLKVAMQLCGHTRFRSTIVTHPDSRVAICFNVRIISVVSGNAVLDANHKLTGGATFEWDAGFDAATGLHEIVLTTEALSAAESPWARFMDPRLE